MNSAYAKTLALTFFMGVGVFNLSRGVLALRSRKENKWIGGFRLVLGVLMLLAPLPLLYFLRAGPTE